MGNRMMRVAPSEIREFLRYDAQTGIFWWTKKPSSDTRAGDRAGCVRRDRYVLIGFRGMMYLAHRLAWYFVYGEWPVGNLDHINGDPLDNRITNLRLCSQSQNAGNTRRHKDAACQYRGVARASKTRWTARIASPSRNEYLGCFKSAEEAARAYDNAAIAKYGEFARLNFPVAA